MRVLLTGCAGFIGYHVAEALLRRGDQVVGLDSINDYYDPALKHARLAQLGLNPDEALTGTMCTSVIHPGLAFQRQSLEDRSGMEGLFSGKAYDLVINLAAQAGVRYSIENPRAYVDANISGFLNVLEGCRHNPPGHLVYASSSSVYGLDGDRPFSVHRGANHPVSMYAATKRANELMAHAYSHLYGLPTTGLRFFTVYGPWGRPDMAYFKFARAIREGQTIDVYNQGDMLRDFTYIDDIVTGILLVAGQAPRADPDWDSCSHDAAGSSAPYRLYNLGNNRPVRLDAFIASLERALGQEAVKRYLPMQPGDVYATEADVDDLSRDFGWQPTTTIDDGLKRFARWFDSL
ncbi:MAG: NAD-dependent epimerase [Spirochaetia bacterium]|jgi:UDP-glucuronate 4-epimerase|nr:NAD-dependent epimerase [Spirochaetia bacterium]